ncbi:MAG: DUF99 domain-containing protein [Desulfobacterium sp.]|nr:DUF99 domain-containing protein [Desulfobacterium sp.]
MKSLKTLIERNLQIRVIGFDDAPFQKRRNSAIYITGAVCAGTVFEGMLWGKVQKDGSDATDVLSGMVTSSKFHEQIHMVLTDGLAFGGFNLIDLPELASQLDRPCVAVMRKPPDIPAIQKALRHFDDCPHRLELLEKAGPVHQTDNFCFQVIGEHPDITAEALKRISNQGNVPEALRIAHLIGSAVVSGQSGRRA